MTVNLTYKKDYTVYPGEYNPLPEVQAFLDELKIRAKDSAAKPLVNMDEYEDCFKIEMVVAGARREDIFINVNENVLSIVVLHKDCAGYKKNKLQIHEFDTESFERHILLPDDADTEFVSAEYSQGILNLYIPKTLNPSGTHTSQVVVY